MIRRINRTGRERILRKHFDLSLRATEGSDASIFDLELRLADYGFPADALVRVEASRSNAVQRWDYGTVGVLTPPSDKARRMTDVPGTARFRVLVVAADGTGKLLGHAPNIKPVLPLGSLLHLEESDKLGDEVWRVEFDGEGGYPVLLVNSSVPGISETVRHDPAFRALVMPAVMRVILLQMILIDRADADDDEGLWAVWFRLAKAYLPDVEPPSLAHGPVDTADIEQAREWIDAVVGAFAKKPLDAAGTYKAALSGGRA